LAASRFSSNTTDVVDLGCVMEAFEQMNRVHLVLTGRVVESAGARRLQFQLEVHDQRYEIGEVPSLVSVRLIPGLSRHTTMESALLWLLYQADAELGRQGWDGTYKAAEPLPG